MLLKSDYETYEKAAPIFIATEELKRGYVGKYTKLCEITKRH